MTSLLRGVTLYQPSWRTSVTVYTPGSSPSNMYSPFASVTAYSGPMTAPLSATPVSTMVQPGRYGSLPSL